MKRLFFAFGLALVMAGSSVVPAVAAPISRPGAAAGHHDAPRPEHQARQLQRPTKDRSAHPAKAPALPKTRPTLGSSSAGRMMVTTASGSIAVSGSTFTVDTATDPASGTDCAAGHAAGACSLRAAVAAADADTGHIDTIVIPSGMEVELTLGATLDLTNSMVIEGTGATVNGEGQEVFAQSGSPAVWINGLTITGGVTTGNGGGMYVSNGSLVLDHVTFDGNVAANGGGMYTSSAAQVWIDNSTFTANVATGAFAAATSGASAAGIFAYGNGGGLYTYGSAYIGRTAFDGNFAEEGAGIYNYDGDVTITNCTIKNNTSPTTFGYGVAVYNDEVMDISNTTIADNVAPYGANGVGLDTEYVLHMENVLFDGNTASGDNTTYGGAIYDDGDVTELVNVTIKDTTVAPTNGESIYGGALLSYAYQLTWTGGSISGQQNGVLGESDYVEGGAMYLDGSHATVTNVTITGTSNQSLPNEYPEGGAIYVNEYATLSDLTIADTDNHGYDVYGGAIYNDDYASLQNITITNTSNHATSINGGYIAGGVIYNDGENFSVTDLTTDHTTNVADTGSTTASSNSSEIEGGTVYNDYESTFTRVSFTNTSSVASGGSGIVYGGGFYNNDSVTVRDLEIIGTTVQAESYVQGGIWYNDDRFNGTNVTFGDGSVTVLGGPMAGTPHGYGTLFYNNSQSNLVNLTLADLTSTVPAVADLAYGIENESLLQLTNATIANVSLSGPVGATWLVYAYGSSQMSLLNSIVASDTPARNCSSGGGTILSAGHNIDSGTTCGFKAAGDKQSVADPMVATLADNGGEILTAALELGSPAIDAGTNTGCPPTDARGSARPKGASCDAGAFEFITGSTYHAVSPYRVLDSRTGHGGSLFHSQVKQTVVIATPVSGVPTKAVAVTGNLTVTRQTNGGFITVAPSLTSGLRPATSTLNFPEAENRANGVTVPLATGGKLDFMYWASSAADTAHVVFDVTGYFLDDTSGATYHTVSPYRVLDSRSSTGGSIFHSQVKQTIAIATTASAVPTDAIGVTGNLTVTGQTNGGYLTIAPSLISGGTPATSTLNFPKGDNRANGVTAPLASGGTLDIMFWSSSVTDTAQVIFDVTGYFIRDTAGATYYAVTPYRVLDSRIARGGTLFKSRLKQVVTVSTAASHVPMAAIAVTGNVTVTGQTDLGFVTAAPSLTSGVLPTTSTINFPIGDTRANNVTVPLASGGKLSFMYWTGTGETTQVIFDVTGYFAG